MVTRIEDLPISQYAWTKLDQSCHIISLSFWKHKWEIIWKSKTFGLVNWTSWRDLKKPDSLVLISSSEINFLFNYLSPILKSNLDSFKFWNKRLIWNIVSQSVYNPGLFKWKKNFKWQINDLFFVVDSKWLIDIEIWYQSVWSSSNNRITFL